MTDTEHDFVDGVCSRCGFGLDGGDMVEARELPPCEPTEAYDDADLKYDIWRDGQLEAADDERKRRRESGDGR